MLPQEVILKKRRGQELSAEEIGFFIRGLTAGDVTHAQAAALAALQQHGDDQRQRDHEMYGENDQ